MGDKLAPGAGYVSGLPNEEHWYGKWGRFRERRWKLDLVPGEFDYIHDARGKETYKVDKTTVNKWSYMNENQVWEVSL